MTPSSPSLQPLACEYCGSTASLTRCIGCKSVYYCSQAHRQSHHADHKPACEAVGTALAEVIKAEIPYRAALFNGSPIIGPHGLLPQARKYASARTEGIWVLLKHLGQAGGRRHVVETALAQSMELMREVESSVRELGRFLPSLLLRVGRDQEAYDFIKGYVTLGHPSPWVHSKLGYLDVKNADVLEYPEFHTDNRVMTWSDLPSELRPIMLSSLILVKVRVLDDLWNIQNAFRALDGFVVPEILDLIRAHLLAGALTSRPEILRRSSDDISALIVQSRTHIMALLDAFEQYKPTRRRLMGPGRRVVNAREAEQHDFCSNSSWVETEGALRTLDRAAKLCETKGGYFSYEYVISDGRKRLVAKDVAHADPSSS
ncbi:unnamed protein product [Clonostachys rosea]|uniref:MYND-type domain-containing protein n=1 Tax=Bionectria ochroleuca TaxID=29856 RepID=A0ABY6UQJ0_BIOOC|nr:unnamed protein product [Clonostachys rosea]